MSKYKTYQGIYKITKPEKYIGTQNPTYRSSWEKVAFCHCEFNTNVIKWSSESIKIPYCWADGSRHNYIPDLYVEMITNDNTIQKFIVEIKPWGQGPSANKAGEVKPRPQRPKNNNPKALKRYINEMVTYDKNERKWQAAQAFCQSNNIKFLILSDEDFTR